MNNLLAPVSNNIWHSVPSSSFPIVYHSSDIGKDSSALNLLFYDLSTFPKYVVLKFEFSSHLMVLNISDCIPSYTSKYSSLVYLVCVQNAVIVCLLSLLLYMEFFYIYLLH